MNIAIFAEKYRVKTRRDECGDTVILGKRWKEQPESRDMDPGRRGKLQYGHQIFECGDGRLGLWLMFYVDNGREIGGSGKTAKWPNAKKKLIAAGFTVIRDGDAEGIAVFDPENNDQARLALKLAGVRVRRRLSEEQRKLVADRLMVARRERLTDGLPAIEN